MTGRGNAPTATSARTLLIGFAVIAVLLIVGLGLYNFWHPAPTGPVMCGDTVMSPETTMVCHTEGEPEYMNRSYELMKLEHDENAGSTVRTAGLVMVFIAVLGLVAWLFDVLSAWRARRRARTT